MSLVSLAGTKHDVARNGVFGTKMKVVGGYPGGNDVILAIERGEVNGRCGWSWSSMKSAQAAWLIENKVNLLAQFALSKHPDLPEVPLIMDLARNDEERTIFKVIFGRQVMAWPFFEVNAVYCASATWASEIQQRSWSSQTARV